MSEARDGHDAATRDSANSSEGLQPFAIVSELVIHARELASWHLTTIGYGKDEAQSAAADATHFRVERHSQSKGGIFRSLDIDCNDSLDQSFRLDYRDREVQIFDISPMATTESGEPVDQTEVAQLLSEFLEVQEVSIKQIDGRPVFTLHSFSKKKAVAEATTGGRVES